MEKELDRLFQQLSNGKKCFNCNNRATASHHLVHRKNELYKWDYRNALPVCFMCHFKLHHTKELENPPHNLTQTSWHGINTKEFRLEKRNELLRKIKDNQEKVG